MIRHHRLSLLAAMSSIAFMAADAGGNDGQTHSARSLEEALKSLSPDTESHWTESGLPRIEHLEAITGQNVSRAGVDEITSGTKRDAWADWRGTKWPDADKGEGGEPNRDEVESAQGIPATPGVGTKEEKVTDDVSRANLQRQASPVPDAKPVPGAVVPFRQPQEGDHVRLTFPAEQFFEGQHSTAVGVIVKVNNGAAGDVNVKVYSPDGGADGFITGVRHADKVLETAVDSPARNLPTYQYLSDKAAT